MDTQLNYLEDWILENACEDSCLVWQLPGVAGLIYSSQQLLDQQRLAREALLKLYDCGVIEVGKTTNASIVRFTRSELVSALTSGEAWLKSDLKSFKSVATIEYWATEDGQILNKELDANWENRTSKIFSEKWQK